MSIYGGWPVPEAPHERAPSQFPPLPSVQCPAAATIESRIRRCMLPLGHPGDHETDIITTMDGEPANWHWRIVVTDITPSD